MLFLIWSARLESRHLVSESIGAYNLLMDSNWLYVHLFYLLEIVEVIWDETPLYMWEQGLYTWHESANHQPGSGPWISPGISGT